MSDFENTALANIDSGNMLANLDSATNLPAFGLGVYNEETQKAIATVRQHVSNNTPAIQIFADITAKTGTGTSQSNFLSLAVQMEEHWTPYRKLRQILLELDNKLQALRTAKNGRRKAFVTSEKLKKEIKTLESVFFNLVEQTDEFKTIIKDDGTLSIKDGATLTLDMALRLNMVDTTFSKGMDSSETLTLIPPTLINALANGVVISDPDTLELLADKIKTIAMYKLVDLDDALANLNSHVHMIRDAETAAAMYLAQGKKIEEIEIPTWQDKYGITSYEEAELFYYVLYFLHEYEKQIRTGDRHVDRGTEGAITQMPLPIQRHIYKMRDIIHQKYYPTNGVPSRTPHSPFMTKEDPEQFYPKKTGDHEWEGLYLPDYMGIDLVSLEKIKKSAEEELQPDDETKE